MEERLAKSVLCKEIMVILNLPPELLDEIFKYLDALSLAKSRQVCRTWRDLHEQGKYSIFWMRACFKDIPKDILEELTGSNDLFYNTCEKCQGNRNGKDWSSVREGAVLSDISWKGVYQEWFRSRHIRRWPCLLHELRGHRGQLSGYSFMYKIIQEPSAVTTGANFPSFLNARDVMLEKLNTVRYMLEELV